MVSTRKKDYGTGTKNYSKHHVTLANKSRIRYKVCGVRASCYNFCGGNLRMVTLKVGGENNEGRDLSSYCNEYYKDEEKYRCTQAKVVAIAKLDGSPCEEKIVYSTPDGAKYEVISYEIGRTVMAKDWRLKAKEKGKPLDHLPKPNFTCYPGIHYFMTQNGALAYGKIIGDHQCDCHDFSRQWKLEKEKVKPDEKLITKTYNIGVKNGVIFCERLD